MELLNWSLIFVGGLLCGFINSFSAAGSLFSLPVLMFAGLPASIANGTNRIGIISLNLIAIAGFKSKEVKLEKSVIWLAFAATLGALLGAFFAVKISEEILKNVLTLVIILFLGLTIFHHSATDNLESLERKNSFYLIMNCFLYFIAGIYGGFIQAGAGFFLMAGANYIQRFSIAKTNFIKVVTMLCYTIPALIIFAYHGQIDYPKGIVLSVGAGLGAWVGSRWSIGLSGKWIRIIMVSMMSLFLIKLVLF